MSARTIARRSACVGDQADAPRDPLRDLTQPAARRTLAVELSGGSTEDWRRVAGAMHKTRMDIAEAITQRDSDRAVQLIRDYHSRVIKRTQSSPRAKEIRETDPGLTAVLSSWLRANVGLGSALDRKL